MIYRTLGSTGINVSAIGMGTWQLGGEWGRHYAQDEVTALVDAAAECGITLIDTAECYGDHESERLVGAALKGRRDAFVVATKFGHAFTGFMKRTDLWSPDQVRIQLEDSLRALQTDHIDIYQFHSGSDAMFDQDDLWAMLRDQVAAGKIRHLGVSVASANKGTHQIALAPPKRAHVAQILYNRLARDPEREQLPLCLELGIGVLSRVPLASGFLSGKYKPGATFSGEDVRAPRSQAEIDQQLATVEEIRRTEVPEGVDMAAWALAWCLRNPAVSCVIPGCRTPDHVRANARAAALVERT